MVKRKRRITANEEFEQILLYAMRYAMQEPTASYQPVFIAQYITALLPYLSDGFIAGVENEIVMRRKYRAAPWCALWDELLSSAVMEKNRRRDERERPAEGEEAAERGEAQDG